MTQRGSGKATPSCTSSPIASVRPSHSFSTKPRAGVSTITFMRNRRASKRLCGSSSPSRSRLEVVRTLSGKRSKNEPSGTAEGSPRSLKNAAPSCASDDLVAMSLRIVVLLVRVVLVDRVAVLRGVRQLHVAAEEARQDGVDVRRVAQHRVAVGEFDPRRRKLVARARRFDERRAAREQVGPQLRVLRARDLAGFPVHEPRKRGRRRPRPHSSRPRRAPRPAST